MLGCWVAKLLFLMWYVVVAREIETKEDRKEREREEREISFFNIILFDSLYYFIKFYVKIKTEM